VKIRLSIVKVPAFPVAGPHLPYCLCRKVFDHYSPSHISVRVDVVEGGVATREVDGFEICRNSDLKAEKNRMNKKEILC